MESQWAETEGAEASAHHLSGKSANVCVRHDGQPGNAIQAGEWEWPMRMLYVAAQYDGQR